MPLLMTIGASRKPPSPSTTPLSVTSITAPRRNPLLFRVAWPVPSPPTTTRPWRRQTGRDPPGVGTVCQKPRAEPASSPRVASPSTVTRPLSVMVSFPLPSEPTMSRVTGRPLGPKPVTVAVEFEAGRLAMIDGGDVTRPPAETRE